MPIIFDIPDGNDGMAMLYLKWTGGKDAAVQNQR
jgi:hypothetical protein